MRLTRPKSLSDLATEQIRLSIIRGEFDLSESLSEAHLSNILGISKTPIREALAALRLQGLVDFVPQKGAFVFCLSLADVTQLCGYRFLLESHALDLSYKNNPKGLIADLDRICTEMAEKLKESEFDAYLRLDAEFHGAFFRHCENEFLHGGYRTVRDIVATMRTHLSKTPARTAKSFCEHKDILDSIRDDQISKVREVLKTQITRGERAYSDLVGTFQPVTPH